MDGKGKAGSSSSSSSSFTAQLFGLKEPSCSSSFKSIFPPPSKGISENGNCLLKTLRRLVALAESTWLGFPYIKPSFVRNNLILHVISDSRMARVASFDYRKESATCNLSSSLYYGGQDIYSGSTSNHTYSTVNRAQPRGDDDASGNNSMDASRGNWWKGSLYY